MLRDAIIEKIDSFISKKALPNILLYGSSVEDQKYIIDYAMNALYKDNKEKKEHMIYINCAFGKGIRFIREDLKFFAKSNLDHITKSIILLFAEELTIDAQSALRRSIEVFHKTTRFFILTQKKHKIMKPILSRFCNIHIHSESSIKLKDMISYQSRRATFNKNIIKKTCTMLDDDEHDIDIYKKSVQLYHQGVIGLDVIYYIQYCLRDEFKKYVLLTYTNRLRKNIKNEIVLLYSLFVFYKMRNKLDLENILIN